LNLIKNYPSLSLHLLAVSVRMSVWKTSVLPAQIPKVNAAETCGKLFILVCILCMLWFIIWHTVRLKPQCECHRFLEALLQNTTMIPFTGLITEIGLKHWFLMVLFSSAFFVYWWWVFEINLRSCNTSSNWQSTFSLQNDFLLSALFFLPPKN
jgi:hypothetical protein